MKPSPTPELASSNQTNAPVPGVQGQDLAQLMASGETLAQERPVELPRERSATLPSIGTRNTAASVPSHGNSRGTPLLQRAMLVTATLLATVLLVPLLPTAPSGADDQWVTALEQSGSGNLRAAMETLYTYERSLPASETGRRALVLRTMANHAAMMGHATQATLLTAKASAVLGVPAADAGETVLPTAAAARTLGIEGGFQTAAQRRADEVTRLHVANLVRNLPATR